MVLTIKNGKAGVTFESLAAGDFFLLDEVLHMKLPPNPGYDPRAVRFSDDGDTDFGDAVGVDDIGWEVMVEPVRVVEMIVERLN